MNTASGRSAFAEALRSRRRAMKLTQDELAEKAGLVRQTISQLENDMVKHPIAQTIMNICQALEDDPDKYLSLLPGMVLPFKAGKAAKAEIIERISRLEAELHEIKKGVQSL